MAEQEPTTPPTTPESIARRERRKRKRSAMGKGKGNGEPIPPPADAATAKQFVGQLVAEAAQAVVSAKPVSAGARALYENMSATTRANIMAMLGPDIEEARVEFANEMLATARRIAQRIGRDIEELPMSSLGFTLAVLTDKSEQLRTKAASSSQGAKVGAQINIFADGSVDKEKLISQLTGAAFALPQPVNVTPPAPSASDVPPPGA